MKGEPPDLFVRRWLTACGAVILLLALVVGVGRLAGKAALAAFVPGGMAMTFASMIGFVIAGASMLAHGRQKPRLGQAAALVLLFAAGGSLILSVLAPPGALERLAEDADAASSGRLHRLGALLSPAAAGEFALLAIALLLLGARRLRVRLVAPCLALLLAGALLAIISYLTGLRFATAWWRYTAMAVPTALGLLAASAALIVWLMRRIAAGQKTFARTFPFFVVASTSVLVLGAVLLVSNQQRLEATHWMNHTLEVDAAIDRFIASVARLEGATRAFALTGDEGYLDRIAVHRSSVTAAANTLIRLTVDNPAQHARARAMLPLIERKFEINDAQVRARREQGAEAAARVLRSEPPELMAGLRASTDGLQDEERHVMLRRREQTAINEARLQWVLIAGALVTVGLVVAAFSLVQKAQGELQAANDQLEERVRARTAQLEASTVQLRESERRLRFLADTMPQLVWTALPDGRIESVNHGYKVYLGARNDAEAIAALATVVHPDDLPVAGREWEAMRREERSAGGELRLRRVDGMYRWHLWRAHPERASDGRILRWVGTSTDMHDLKVAEEELERRVLERTAQLAASEGRFRQAFEFAGIGMAIVALDGRWVRVNKSICDLVGYTEEELLQKTFQDITHPDDLAADLAHVRELVAGERRSYQMEKRYFHRDGHIVWVRLTVSLVRDNADRPVHFVSQVEDITEHKRLEVNLAAARDQALEASRLKSEFLATMSHEIRTPMNGVIGMTALLRDTPLTPTQADYVRTIELSGESLLTIINDILDYSKIEAGRIELEVAPFDLRQCLDDALDLFMTRARDKHIALGYTLVPGVPLQVAGDATRLRQILVNLIGNALKFTERGRIDVTVAADEPDAESGQQRLRFAIRDTGIGIPAEGMDRLFKSFSQVDASTTRRFGGTGLGLAISKRLAELMGGTMWAESRIGEGSTFHFTTRVQPQADSPATRTRGGAVPAHDSALGERCPLRLLIAEDNPVNQRVATLLLQRLGYRANAVANGLEALAAIEMADYDAVLMDVEMPELDGCEATRRIRALRHSATRPWIIALTAGAMQDDRERALAAGMNDFLTKPVRTDALSAALGRAYAGLNGGAPAPKGG